MHSTAPRIIQTFIESNGLTEKNVYLFCTSGSSGNDKSLRNLQPLYPYINFAAESIAAADVPARALWLRRSCQGVLQRIGQRLAGERFA